jgi:Short-chain dehydrogenases of various substrate specificities
MGFEKTEATILITGASDGLGKEAARKLATQGACLILHGRSEAKLQAAVDEILNEFPDARIVNLSSIAHHTILLRLALCRWTTFLDTSLGFFTPAQNCC